MKEIKTIDIPIEDIEDNPFYARRFEEFDKEDIKQLSKSFERSGLLNPIIVREKPKDKEEEKTKYQLIAGKRRKKGFEFAGKTTITARIVEADDMEVQIMSLAENYHRKDLSTSEKENYIYRLWNTGNEKGIFHNNLHIMEDWTGISHQILSDIVNAGKEKEQDDSDPIRFATSKDLQRTRGIKDIPDIRKLLLEDSVIKKKIKVLDLESLVKVIKKGKVEGGLEDDVLHGIIELIADNKLSVYNVQAAIDSILVLEKEDQIKIIEKFSRDKSEDKEKLSISVFDLKAFVDVYMQSFDDVKEKLLSSQISWDEATELNKFKFRDQREKVLVELKQFNTKIKNVESKKLTYLRKRAQQARDLEDENIKTIDFDDIKKFGDIDEEELKIIDKIIKIKKELLHLDFEKINKFNVGNRDFAIEFLWEIYNRFHRILIDLGEIKSDIDIEKDEEDIVDDTDNVYTGTGTDNIDSADNIGSADDIDQEKGNNSLPQVITTM